MQRFYKTLSSFLITSIVASAFSFAAIPQKANAQWVVIDPANIVQSTISAIANTSSSVSQYLLQYKELVLDGIAYMIAKQFLRAMTTSVVNWINSGFSGSPSFLANPEQFFADIGDQIVGDFIAQNGDLKYLCSPFSIDIKIALALRYRPYQRNRYACTLSTIIKNVTQAGKNATINGFTAGDFRQGGWPAFVSLTTEPQNNVYGAYLLASNEVSVRIGDKVSQQKDELGQGKGFLSWKKCKPIPVEGEAGFVGPAQQDPLSDDQTAEAAYNNARSGNGPAYDSSKQYTNTSNRQQTCETQTPGSVISGVLETQLGSPVRELELADEFNEIVNALVAQLVSTVLTGGLRGASGSGPSDQTSYINQLQKLSASEQATLDSFRTSLVQSIDNTYLAATKTYKQNKDAALALVLNTKNIYDETKACYGTRANQGNAQTQISRINTDIAAQFTPIEIKVTAEAADAANRLATLEQIKTDVLAAKTIDQFSIPSQRYNDLLQSQRLTTAKDIVDSKEGLAEVTRQIGPITRNAEQELMYCKYQP